MEDEQQAAAVAKLQELLSTMVGQLRMQYGIAMQEYGMDDLAIAIVHLKSARAMEQWFENNQDKF